MNKGIVLTICALYFAVPLHSAENKPLINEDDAVVKFLLEKMPEIRQQLKDFDHNKESIEKFIHQDLPEKIDVLCAQLGGVADEPLAEQREKLQGLRTQLTGRLLLTSREVAVLINSLIMILGAINPALEEKLEKLAEDDTTGRRTFLKKALRISVGITVVTLAITWVGNNRGWWTMVLPFELKDVLPFVGSLF